MVHYLCDCQSVCLRVPAFSLPWNFIGTRTQLVYMNSLSASRLPGLGCRSNGKIHKKQPLVCAFTPSHYRIVHLSHCRSSTWLRASGQWIARVRSAPQQTPHFPWKTWNSFRPKLTMAMESKTRTPTPKRRSLPPGLYPSLLRGERVSHALRHLFRLKRVVSSECTFVGRLLCLTRTAFSKYFPNLQTKYSAIFFCLPYNLGEEPRRLYASLHSFEL